MPPIRGVILDIDGTLVDSNDAHAQAWVRAFAEHGVEVPFDKVRWRVGMGGDKLMPAVSGIEEETDLGSRISKRRGELFKKEYLPTLQPLPGAEDLLRHLRERGHRLVVASSAKKDELGGLLKVCRAEKYVEAKTSSDDAENSKPDPDIVQAALKNLGLPPEQAVMLGDTPYDIEAAGQTGVGVIAFRSGGWKEVDLAGALAVYDHPADLLAQYDDSPLTGSRAGPYGMGIA